MGKYRVGRVGEALKEEISQIVREELKDPRVGFVTVTAVEAAPDFSHARVYVSVLGSADDVKESLQILNRAAGFVRSEVGKRVRLHHTPEIVFKLDQSLEHGLKISNLLHQVQDETKSGEKN